VFIPVILRQVKVTISLPDALYERAERAAQRLGRSRSALYAEALASYLTELDDEVDDVTAALDALHGDIEQAAPSGVAAGRQLIDAGKWEW